MVVYTPSYCILSSLLSRYVIQITCYPKRQRSHVSQLWTRQTYSSRDGAYFLYVTSRLVHSNYQCCQHIHTHTHKWIIVISQCRTFGTHIIKQTHLYLYCFGKDFLNHFIETTTWLYSAKRKVASIQRLVILLKMINCNFMWIIWMNNAEQYTLLYVCLADLIHCHLLWEFICLKCMIIIFHTNFSSCTMKVKDLSSPGQIL